MNKAITDDAELVHQRKHWLVDRPGIITQVANELGVSQPFVSDVFYGRRTSRGGRVERKLKKLGAPGFAQ